MDRMLSALFDKSLKPNRVHHLVVSDSKHLFYRESDQLLGYQKKDLDPRTCGKRKMLTRTIMMDEDSGVFYGELVPSDDVELLGFLARAWATKKTHPMKGFPTTLHVSSKVLESASMADDLRALAKLGNVQIRGALSGFGPGTVAAREYERELMSLGIMGDKVVLAVADMAAQEISSLACRNAIAGFDQAWRETRGLDASVLRWVDARYKSPGYWRSGAFSFVLSPEEVEALAV